MGVPAFIYAIFAIAMLSMFFLKNWSYVFLTASVEIVWVFLCIHLSALVQTLNDVFFFMWVVTLMFFSSIELALTAAAFTVHTDLQNSHYMARKLN